MHQFAIVVSVIVAIVGGIISMISLTLPVTIIPFYIGAILGVDGLTMTWPFYKGFMRNEIIRKFENVAEEKADLEVVKQKKNDLSEQIRGDIEKFTGYNKDVISMVTNRKGENLQALMENYPELKGIESIKSLVTQLIKLRESVASQEKLCNQRIGNYNSYVKTSPRKNIIPEGCPAGIDFMGKSTS